MRRPTENTQRRTAPEPVAPDAAALQLPPGVANRELARYARTLSRDPKPITVYLVGPPPPVEALKRATSENAKLALLIDEAEKLTDEQLRKRLGEVGAKAVGPTDASQEAALTQLHALEFMARRRRLAPSEPNYSGYKDTTRRLNVRALIERGVRETGSFEKAMGTFTHTREVESDVEYFEAEAARFAKEFTRQARRNAERILTGSYAAIKAVFESYGVRGYSAWYHAMEVRKGKSLEAEADAMVKKAAQEAFLKEKRDDPHAEHRGNLRNQVKALRARQQKIKDLTEAEKQAWTKVKMNTKGPEVPEAEKATRAKQAAQQELSLAWLRAEAAHPLLAAYRESGDLEQADLSLLDQDTEERMKAMAIKLLPKIVDIDHVYRLISSNQLSPLALPPVVALTRTNMFVPDGSLRAGVVNDLAVAAQSSESWILTAAAIALALVLLIPSGGSSLGIAAAGIAGAGLATYSAVREWERYKLQKRLYNTDLDVARALATEEPSLTSFALSLVALGMEGLPLVGAFARARRLKRLVDAGEEASDAARATVRELDDLGSKHGRPDLGRRALGDIKAAFRPKASPVAKVAKRPPKDPLNQLGRVIDHPTVDDFRKEFGKAVGGLKHGESDLNPMLADLMAAIKKGGLPKTRANKKLLAQLPKVIKATRDPAFVEKVAAEIWTEAARRGVPPREVLEELVAGRAAIQNVTKLEDPEKFRAVISKAEPFRDLEFASDVHGAHTHMFQELLVSRALGGPKEGRRFRQLIAQATGPNVAETAEGGKLRKFWSAVWDGLFDDLNGGGHINHPETLGRFLQEHLGLPRWNPPKPKL